MKDSFTPTFPHPPQHIMYHCFIEIISCNLTSTPDTYPSEASQPARCPSPSQGAPSRLLTSP